MQLGKKVRHDLCRILISAKRYIDVHVFVNYVIDIYNVASFVMVAT